jgi:cytidyltransferase-like protein
MSGINHLYDIYNKKGQEFVDQLFNTYVTVNEKMDGSAFTFERDKETGKFKFYRRDQRNPITFVDRTLMKYYEKPIQYIESLSPHILEQIPRGWRFGLEYFANTKPVEITYDTMPKNHLILSYVHEFGEDGKIKKTVQNKEELDNWADLLGIDRAPIIFQGYLTEDQKLQILDFLKTPFDQLVERFKTQSFVRFIIGTLNPDLKKSALNNDLDKDVEGIVFRFGDSVKDSEPVLAKMVDPVFTQMAKDKSVNQKENKPSDFLGITLLDVMNFILEEGLDSFKVEGEDEDERYVSFMSDVFVKFLEENEDKYRGADFEEPDYLKREEFRLNKDLVDDRRVLKYVNEDDSFESLFKLMLNSFRKIKSRAGGIITKGMMEQMNLLIRDIKDYIEKPRKGKMNESFMSFLDFRKENSPVVEYLKEEDSETEADENPFYSYGEFITALETIDNSKSGVVEEKEEKKDLKDVNLLVGRFQPFHNGHLKMAKFLKEKNDFPSVAVVVYPGHNKSGKSPFKEDTIKKYMDGIVRDESEIADYIIVQRGLIGSAIVKLLEKGYKPHLIGAGEDRVDDYTKQLEYVKKSEIGEEMKDLKLVKTPRVTSATKVREAIADDNYQEVKRLVPKGVSVLYNTLKSEVDGTGVNESLVYEILNEGENTGFEWRKKLDYLISTARNLPEKINYYYSDDISPAEIKSIEKLYKLFGQIENITKNLSQEEKHLLEKLPEMIFGPGGDQKIKREKVDEFIHHLTSKTIESLSKTLIENQREDCISFQDALSAGIVKILPGEFNGVFGSHDLDLLYNIDPKIAVGNNKRGKGETLFCLAFDAYNNPEKGGDVYIKKDGEKRVVEIKSTNNSGITPSLDNDPDIISPISNRVYEIMNIYSSIYSDSLSENSIKELESGVIQKNTTRDVIDSIDNGEEKKLKELDKSLREKLGLGYFDFMEEKYPGKSFISLLLLEQLNYYSKNSILFQTLAVFIENKNKLPNSLVMIDSVENNFISSKNVSSLIESDIIPKITKKKRMEIYTFDNKK